MNIVKYHLADIERCYCASHMYRKEQLYIFFASENPESECYLFTGENFEKRETVWDNRGGCMSIIPFEKREGEFLAVNEFYLKVSPSLAKLVWGKKKEDGWEIKDVISLPFLHRFDIYHIDGKDYFIGATIARDKKNKEDWSLPGQIYVAEIPEDPSNGFEIKEIADGLFRNHGYCRGRYQDKVCGYFGSDQGVFRVVPPIHNRNDWEVEKILDTPVGEIAFADINNDGKDEMMTIEPFHGNQIKVYKEIDGKYICDYIYPNVVDFAHCLIGTTINGVNSFVAGVRRCDCELFVLQYAQGEYRIQYVDKGVGPANIDIVHRKNGDMILSANHTKNEAAIYIIEE